MVLMDLLALEKACFDFIDTKRLICIELSQPEITLGGLQAIISIDRLNDSDIKTVALLTQSEFAKVG